jgi:hypothetical protein
MEHSSYNLEREPGSQRHEHVTPNCWGREDNAAYKVELLRQEAQEEIHSTVFLTIQF